MRPLPAFQAPVCPTSSTQCTRPLSITSHLTLYMFTPSGIPSTHGKLPCHYPFAHILPSAQNALPQTFFPENSTHSSKLAEASPALTFSPLNPNPSTTNSELSLPISCFRSVAHSFPTLCDPMNRSTPGLPVHHQLLQFTQTYIHQVGDAIQPSHPLSSPSPPAHNPSQHQGLFQ